MRLSLVVFGFVLLAFQPAICSAGNFIVLLQDKQFIYNDKSVETIDIKKGDRVTFKNNDSIKYEIYSKSVTKPFDLGAMKPGASKHVIFKKAGEVEVSCKLHADMYLDIIVK